MHDKIRRTGCGPGQKAMKYPAIPAKRIGKKMTARKATICRFSQSPRCSGAISNPAGHQLKRGAITRQTVPARNTSCDGSAVLTDLRHSANRFIDTGSLSGQYIPQECVLSQ